MATLTYSITEPALRLPVAEWQPHGKQSESTTEWWYLTALVHDTAGSPYFLVWSAVHFTGEKTFPASADLLRSAPHRCGAGDVCQGQARHPGLHSGGSAGGPELLLFAAAGRDRRPDHLHRKGRRPARDRRDRAGMGRPPVGRLPDHVLVVDVAALLHRRPGQSVQLRQPLPGRDLPEGRRLDAIVGLLSRPPERLPQDAQAGSMAV